eukprot:PITA_28234
MKLVSWNIRGLNSPRKLRMLKHMIKKEKPHMCFLQETKCNNTTLGSILAKAWPGCNSVAVDASRASGGLAIAWNLQVITLSDLHAAHHLIHATFHILGSNIHGNVSNVYFPQDAGSKIGLLDTIAALNNSRRYPLWIVAGDFNMITKTEEKLGGRHKLEQEDCHFKDFIQASSLIDMPFCNGTLTWSNRRAGRHQIASKLDRFLLSDNAVHLGGDISSVILAHPGSDHSPIALQWQRPGSTIKRPFIFESFWLTHPNFKEDTFGDIFKEQQKLTQDLEPLHHRIIAEGHSETTLQQESSILSQLEIRRKQEEIYWRQKSRVRWLKEGERNTKFFHRTTIQRRMHNNIPFIQNRSGAKVEAHEEIEKELLNHFKQILTEDGGDRRQAIQKITNNIPKIIMEEQNELLM